MTVIFTNLRHLKLGLSICLLKQAKKNCNISAAQTEVNGVQQHINSALYHYSTYGVAELFDIFQNKKHAHNTTGGYHTDQLLVVGPIDMID